MGTTDLVLGNASACYCVPMTWTTQCTVQLNSLPLCLLPHAMIPTMLVLRGWTQAGLSPPWLVVVHQ
jgi:hypothetical protein